MARKDRIHVVKRGGNWVAEREGAKRVSAREPTQGEIERRAKEIARNTGGAEVVIHRRDGVIRDSDTVGKRDPNPPRDKKH